MARPLDQILGELNAVYNPQKDVINSQIGALDPQQQEEQKGLEAAKQDAFGQITQQANRRGLFYSGIPVAEEQKYTGASFLPAVANLRSRYAQQRFNLQNALADLTKDQYLKGQDIYQTEMNRDAEDRRAAANRAALASPSFGGGQVQGATSGYGYQQKADKGFAFVDQNGRPISAASYAAATNTPFRDLLQWMANQGDAGAKNALGFVGNDFGYDPRKLGTRGNLYNSLVWGTPYQDNMPIRSLPLNVNSPGLAR